MPYLVSRINVVETHCFKCIEFCIFEHSFRNMPRVATLMQFTYGILFNLFGCLNLNQMNIVPIF